MTTEMGPASGQEGAGMPGMIRHDLDGGILTFTFDRPKALNAVNLAMAREMRDLACRLPDLGKDAKAIVVRGAGPAFMAGGDVREFDREIDGIGLLVREIIGGFHDFITALADAPQPVLASIGGAAAGGGLSLALACDLVIASSDAKLAFAYRQLGTSPDGGSTFSLPRAVGAKRAADLLLLRDAIPAEEALALGLINRVVPPDELEAETARVARRLAANAVAANAGTKALLRRSLDRSLAEQLAAERRTFEACAATADFKEGVAAFIGRRPPAFGPAAQEDTQ